MCFGGAGGNRREDSGGVDCFNWAKFEFDQSVNQADGNCPLALGDEEDMKPEDRANEI